MSNQEMTEKGNVFGSSGHVRSIALELYVAEELPEDGMTGVTAHAQSCGECSARLEEIRQDIIKFQEEVPYAGFRVEHERRRESYEAGWQMPVWAWLTSATAAAAVVVGLAVVPPSQDTADSIQHDERIKGPERSMGAASLEFAVLSGGQLLKGIPGQPLASGERLQLSYSAGVFSHMAVIGVDGVGEVECYFPDAADRLAPLPEGAAGNLPFSLILDDTPGTERFVGIFGNDAVDLAPIMEAAENAAARGLPSLDLPRGLEQSWVWVNKK